VGTNEGDDEDLIFESEARELGESELAFDGDLLFGDSDALDHNGRALRDAEQVLPIGCGFWVVCHRLNS
jgi:hypothetical protein